MKEIPSDTPKNGTAATAPLPPEPTTPDERPPDVAESPDLPEPEAPEHVPAPVFLHHLHPPRPARSAPVPRWHWLLLAALALLLTVQILLAERIRLAADARWRPLLSAVCGVLHCTLPPWHEPEAFVMLEREVRPLAARPGVLQVQARFRNQARWAQAWPTLRFSLSDADGRLIGQRLLPPRDYLTQADDWQQPLAPGQSAQIRFHLREPAQTSVAFRFEFL